MAPVVQCTYLQNGSTRKPQSKSLAMTDWRKVLPLHGVRLSTRDLGIHGCLILAWGNWREPWDGSPGALGGAITTEKEKSGQETPFESYEKALTIGGRSYSSVDCILQSLSHGHPSAHSRVNLVSDWPGDVENGEVCGRWGNQKGGSDNAVSMSLMRFPWPFLHSSRCEQTTINRERRCNAHEAPSIEKENSLVKHTAFSQA